MQIRKILVPIDFSDGAKQATDMAEDVARKFGAKLVLFHAYTVPVSPLPDGAATLSAAQMLELEAAMRKLMDRTSERILAAGVEVDCRIVPGLAWREICREAEEGGYDLIVIGTHGRTGLRHIVLGSVAERVVRHAPCPVMTVRAKS